jgi:hypothetical protein
MVSTADYLKSPQSRSSKCADVAQLYRTSIIRYIIWDIFARWDSAAKSSSAGRIFRNSPSRCVISLSKDSLNVVIAISQSIVHIIILVIAGRSVITLARRRYQVLHRFPHLLHPHHHLTLVHHSYCHRRIHLQLYSRYHLRQAILR